METEYEQVRAVLLSAVRSVKPALADAELTGDEHLAAELGVDSVDRMELLIAVEEAFDGEGEVDPRVFMIPASLNELADRIAVVAGASA